MAKRNKKKQSSTATEKFNLTGTLIILSKLSKDGFIGLSKVTAPDVKGVIYDDTREFSLTDLGNSIVESYKYENGKVTQVSVLPPFIDKNVLARVVKSEDEIFIQLTFDGKFDSPVVVKNGEIIQMKILENEDVEVEKFTWKLWKDYERDLGLNPDTLLVINPDEE